MKRLIALVLAGLMVLGGMCFAAEWPQGCSPAQPYSHVPEVNLSETMGYIMMFPRTKLPAARFCDVLQMYLPRTDLKLGEGTVRLYENVEGEKEPVEVCKVDFTDADSVNSMIWALFSVFPAIIAGIMMGLLYLYPIKK